MYTPVSTPLDGSAETRPAKTPKTPLTGSTPGSIVMLEAEEDVDSDVEGEQLKVDPKKAGTKATRHPLPNQQCEIYL